MSEAEVALKFALQVLEIGRSKRVEVNIDGAVLKLTVPAFEVKKLLASYGWTRSMAPSAADWRGTWAKDDRELQLSSKTGRGDVISAWGGKNLVAECKGGPLERSKSGKERVILQNAIGQ